jgi:2-polyprenyl-3-methyl-5-hydroxy-6-metoxy-1,4-benzoquinol methylase
MTVIEQDVGVAADESDVGEAIGALAGRIFEAGVGAMELIAVHLGKELGLYDVLAAHDWVTAPELAGRAGIHPRYAREWLEQQAVAEFLTVDDPGAGPDERRYTLPPASAAVLADERSMAYLAPFGAFVVALGQTLPHVAAAYRTGGGLSFGGFGELVRDAQAALNRPQYETLLAGWVQAAVPDVHARLSMAGGRIADLGCGCGWSTIALSAAYPSAQVDGVDDDTASIEAARRHATDARASNVRFLARDAAEPGIDGRYDLVCILEALHDMPQPVEVLRADRELLAPGGAVLVLDERVADTLAEGIGQLIERFMHAASVGHCLPVGMSSEPSEATGTVMRVSTIHEYARRAGLELTVLPIEHDCWRFYRLDPSTH